MFPLEVLLYFGFTGLLISILLNKELEESISIVFIIDGIIISLFTYLKNVRFGFYASLFIIPAIMLLHIFWLLRKNRITSKDLIKKFSIRNISIIFIFIYAYLFCRTCYISQPDAIHLWGIRVFDMLKNNSLVSQSTLVYQKAYTKYPLFLSSIQSLFCYIGGGYKEPWLFFATISFCFSLLINIIPKLKIEKYTDCYKMFIFLGLIMILGLCFCRPFYITILSDAPIAIFAALTIYKAYTCNLKDIKDIIVLILYCLGLLMSKEICLIFFCIVLIFVIVNNIKFNNRRTLLSLFIGLSFMGILILFGLKRALNLSTFNLIIDSISTYGIKKSGVINSFFYAIFNNPTYSGMIPTPYFYYLSLECIGFILLNIINKNHELRKKNIKLTIILFLGGFVWLLAHLYFAFYLFGQDFVAQTPVLIPEYGRYMDTYLYMLLTTFFIIFAINMENFPNVISLFIPFTLIFCVHNTSDFATLIPGHMREGIILNQKFLNRLDILDDLPDNSNLLIVDQNLEKSYGLGYDEYTSYYYYIFNMNKKADTVHFGKFNDPDYPNKNLYVNDCSLKEYISHISKYNYIYLSNIDDDFINNYWKPSTDNEIFVYGLYKVISIKDNSIELQFVDLYQ